MHVPAALASREHWIVWKYVKKNGRKQKVPYSAIGGKLAKSNDRRTWCSLATAEAVVWKQGYDGLGFVFAVGDDLCGIDMDVCIGPNRELTPWALKMLNAFPTYAEVSPSKTGIKLFVFGTHQETGLVLPMRKIDDGPKQPAIEIYGWGRYFAFTGSRWPDSPAELADCSSSLAVLVGHIKKVRRPIAPPRPPTRPATINQLERARIYLSRTPATTCGTSTCHNRTFRAACVLVRDIGLSPEQAATVFKEWAAKGTHEWSDRELMHKLTSAANGVVSNT